MDVFAVGAGGIILHYDGTSWTSMTSGVTNTLYGIGGKAVSDIAHAVGQSGTILRYAESKPPAGLQVDPAQGVQGETMQFSITGNDLGSATEVDFGAGVIVNSFTSVDSSLITGSLTIDPLTARGARDVTVTTPAGTTVLTGGFTVEQAPPTITGTDTATGMQGTSLSVVITGSYLEGATSVDFGPGVTVDGFTSGQDSVTANITIDFSLGLATASIA